ncbi:hypothetical protein ACS0TY_031074 [Phlomoides rotata]
MKCSNSDCLILVKSCLFKEIQLNALFCLLNLDDNRKAKALNLNEIFSQYQENRNSAHEVLKSQKKQEEQVVETTEKNGDANVAPDHANLICF